MKLRTLPHEHHNHKHQKEIQRQLNNVQDFQNVSDTFKLLDDNSRLRIFWLLCHTEECVINIAAMMNMTTPAVSHHLKLLRANGLITARRDGKEVHYKSANTPKAEHLHKSIEMLMEIVCPPEMVESEMSMDQIGLIHSIHDYTMDHLDHHLTVEALSQQFHINPTSLKVLFKEVYGTPIATHMKEHRMEKASELLENTDASISEIARKVGYSSQSKFTAAFKEKYQITPKEYRRTIGDGK